MFDFAAVDVALGLIFLYLVLALVCSALNETLSALLAWRAKMLREGLENLLAGHQPSIREAGVKAEKTGKEMVEALYEHPLMRGLIRRRRRRIVSRLEGEDKHKPRYPSYVPARTFVTALLNVSPAGLAPPAHLKGEELQAELKRANAKLTRAINEIESTPVREALLALKAQAGGDVMRFQLAAETWYDDVMERVSGWYRRRVQLFLWIFAIAVVAALNADTIQIGRTLWSDKTVRAAVVARATDVAKCKDLSSEDCKFTTIQKDVDELRGVHIPLGWTNANETWPVNETWPMILKVLLKVLGLLMTAAALSLGAPFWFDMLSKVSRIRSSGAPPPATDAKRTGEGAQERSGDNTLRVVVADPEPGPPPTG